MNVAITRIAFGVLTFSALFILTQVAVMVQKFFISQETAMVHGGHLK
jgi:hypothetical protein